MRQRITTKQFIDEINNLGIDFSEPTKKKMVLVFDEDFNEYITYKEFIETCEAFGAELPLELPKDYVSVSKRALMKVVKKMKKKGIKPDFLFKMKDTDEVDIEDFKNFFRNTINARIKKREEHSLFVLCDKDRNNTVNKEEFVSLYKKGEKFLDEPNMPVKNNLFGPDEAAEEIEYPISKRKPKLVKQETSMQYSGDAKSEIVKIIHERDFISIEQFLSSAFNWDFDDFVSYDDLENKATQLMPSIPGEDLRALFDDLDTSGEERIKVKNLIKVLKDEIHKQGNDKTSLLTVEDVISQYGSKSPRSCSSLAIQELKEH